MRLEALLRSQILPANCALCGARASQRCLCAACWHDLPRSAAVCPRCARPMPGQAVCGRCMRRPPAFDAAIAALRYAFPVDLMIARAKYNGDLALAATLADAIIAHIEEYLAADVRALDHVVPVPLSPARQVERGYNQATELARIVADHFAIPLATHLIRIRETAKQADLPFKARLKNVRNAFSAASFERPLAGKSVLLIDDVMTTGATLNEATKALKSAGAIRVIVAVAARAVPRHGT